MSMSNCQYTYDFFFMYILVIVKYGVRKIKNKNKHKEFFVWKNNPSSSACKFSKSRSPKCKIVNYCEIYKYVLHDHLTSQLREREDHLPINL